MLVNMRFAPEILPVVRVNTYVSLMLLLTIGTPNCFKMENIKVSILFHLMKNIDRKFTFMMSESAHFPVVTTCDPVGIELAIFCFILLGMVKVFYKIVCFYALIFQLAFSFADDVLTKFRYVVDWRPSTVFVVSVVVVETFFRIVIFKYCARLSLKSHQI
jgi:hypothetical protein